MNEQPADRTTVEGVFRLVESGQLGAAEEFCRTHLERQPNDVNILGLLGAILLKQRRLSDAQVMLERAIRLAPEFAKPHEDLGMLHLWRKQPELAIPCFETAIRAGGDQPGPYSGLADAHARLGNRSDAEAARAKYLQLSPTARSLENAAHLMRQGDPAAAEKIYEGILRKDSANAAALRMLARIATDDERYIIAEGLLKRLAKLTPDHYQAYAELGRFLGDRGRIPEAIVQMQKAVELGPDVADNHRVLADMLSIVGRVPEALEAYRQATALAPRDAAALAGEAHTLRILGEAQDAIASYEKCLKLRPDAGDAWWSLATMPGYRFGPELLESLNAQLDDDEVDDNTRVHLHFALARAAEKQRDYDRAWRHYEQGNDLKRGLVQYDPVEIEVAQDAIIETFDEELLKRASTANIGEAAPIFIVGLPRSGSTLIEQILASHSRVEGGGELPYVVMLSRSLGGTAAGGQRYPEILKDMTSEQFEGLGKNYLYQSRNHRREDLPYFTDKMPANFLHVGLIHLALPNATIIDARRHPLDTCLANYRQLFAQGKNQSYDLFELAEYYLGYRRVMAHWDAVFPGRVLRVRYEDVVADTEGETRRMLEHCGLQFEESCMNFFDNDRPVNTASSEQVRQPIYKDSVGFWKTYEDKLAGVRELLADVLPD